jgi:hypothetical protein
MYVFLMFLIEILFFHSVLKKEGREIVSWLSSEEKIVVLIKRELTKF